MTSAGSQPPPARIEPCRTKLRRHGRRLCALTTLALVLACGARPPATDTDTSNETRSGEGGTDTAPLANLSDAACEDCHPAATSAWRRSRHHTSFTNPDFTRSYAREPKTFCRDCHAPALARPPDLRLGIASAQELGVGCIDCHVDPERPAIVLTGSGSGTCEAGDCAAPHPLQRDTAFGTRSCAPCHEFDFPSDSRRPVGTMMQTTMREHLASEYSQVSCADCHLPPAPSGAPQVHDHSLDSSRSPIAIRAAVVIEARRDGDSLVLNLTPRGVGHAFPTGDLFRRLEIGAILHIGDRELASARRYLDREFADWRHADGSLNPAWHMPVPDDRLRGPTTIKLDLRPLEADLVTADQRSPRATSAAQTTIAWYVDYQRVDARNDRAPEHSTLASAVRLAEGELP